MKEQVKPTLQLTEPRAKYIDFDPRHPHDLESMGSILRRIFKVELFVLASEKLDNQAA